MSDGYTLGEIARVIGAPAPAGAAAGRRVTGYSLDSRSIEDGELFVAVAGERFDGRAFVKAALARGAAGALMGREAGPNGAPSAAAGVGEGDPVLAVEDGPQALQALAAWHRQRVGIPVVAVTGTNGKTTTKDVIAHVLGQQARVCASVGNLNSQLGMPLTLLNRMGREHQVGVFEVGMSARGEIARLCAVLKPDRGVVTNVGPAHTQFLGDVENVFRAKSELVEALPAAGRLYLNAECRFHARMRAAFAGEARRVSLHDASADLRLEVASVDLNGIRGKLHVRGEDAPRELWMPIPGLHMAYPALFAVAVALDLGFDVSKAIESLASCRPAKHRMQVVGRGGVTILDDCYNANPPSTEALLDFVRALRHAGRKVLVLGDMLELGELALPSHRKIVERVVADRAFDRAWFVGPIYREAAAAVPAVADALREGRVRLAEDCEPVAGQLKDELSDGDLLVLKASRGIGLDQLLEAL